MKRLGLLLILVLFLVGCSGTKEPAPKVAKIPTIPHAVTQDMDCKSCHENGTDGAKVTKHLDRTNCTGCHKTQE